MFSFRHISSIYQQMQTILLEIIIFNTVTKYLMLPFSNDDKALIKNLPQFKE